MPPAAMCSNWGSGGNGSNGKWGLRHDGIRHATGHVPANSSVPGPGAAGTLAAIRHGGPPNNDRPSSGASASACWLVAGNPPNRGGLVDPNHERSRVTSIAVAITPSQKPRFWRKNAEKVQLVSCHSEFHDVRLSARPAIECWSVTRAVCGSSVRTCGDARSVRGQLGLVVKHLDSSWSQSRGWTGEGAGVDVVLDGPGVVTDAISRTIFATLHDRPPRCCGRNEVHPSGEIAP